MKVGTALIAVSLSPGADWSDRRERRAGWSRRAEDRPSEAQAAPSIPFLAQVVSQTCPDASSRLAGYGAAHRWRCGVCADERA